MKKKIKSIYAKKVLQLMDDDYTYYEALMKVLQDHKQLNRAKLEKELNYYI